MVVVEMMLYQGDCLEIMETLPTGSVDMILCDLPYGTTNCKWDSPLPLDKLWKHYNRICNGAVVLFAQTPFDKVLGSSNLAMLRYEWVWEKSNPTGYLNAKKAPMKAHENILVFCQSAPPYTPQKTFGHPRKQSTRKSQNSVYGEHAEVITYDSTERYPRSVLKFASDKQKSKLHPTQKPVALCEYLINTYTKTGDVVLDNCMGSGSTGKACANTGRRFIGIEKDADYFAKAKQRLNII